MGHPQIVRPIGKSSRPPTEGSAHFNANCSGSYLFFFDQISTKQLFPSLRKYYYNPQTKETRWETPTPEDLEVAISSVGGTVFTFDSALKTWVPAGEGQAQITVLKKRDAYRIVAMSEKKQVFYLSSIYFLSHVSLADLFNSLVPRQPQYQCQFQIHPSERTFD